MKNNFNIAYLTTWPPRECGIATFAYDLAKAIEKENNKLNWSVIALDDPPFRYKYDKKVIYKIDRTNIKSFLEGADFINQSDIDILIIHHEFNFYGKYGGGKILPFLKRIKKPKVVIFHSIPHPNDRKYDYKKRKIQIAYKISTLIQKVIVISNIAKKRLIEIYKVDPKKIIVIPHGSPEPPKIKKEIAKKNLGFTNNILLLNFGFIRKRKGLETIIKAMPKIVKKYPLVKLVFLGGEQSVGEKETDNYIKELITLSKKINVANNVLFIRGYIPIEKVMIYLKAADIFIYTNTFKSQVSSGPLTYAFASNDLIISTAFSYAEDILANGRGLIIPIGDYKSLANAVCKILENPNLRKKIERKIKKLSKKFLWKAVAKEYLKTFNKILNFK